MSERGTFQTSYPLWSTVRRFVLYQDVCGSLSMFNMLRKSRYKIITKVLFVELKFSYAKYLTRDRCVKHKLNVMKGNKLLKESRQFFS